MRFLRKIEGKTRRDRIRNKIIRETVGVQSVQEYVQRSQLRWYGHGKKMDDKRIVKRVYEAREIGKRPMGRPRKTWKEGRVTRGDKKERSDMERGGKDSKGQREVEGCLGFHLHRKVEEDGINKSYKVSSNDTVPSDGHDRKRVRRS
jgi:hypothetical protein